MSPLRGDNALHKRVVNWSKAASYSEFIRPCEDNDERDSSRHVQGLHCHYDVKWSRLDKELRSHTTTPVERDN